MTNKMQLFHTTCTFMVQDRAFTLTAIVVLAVVIVLCDSLNSQVLHVLIILAAHRLKITGVKHRMEKVQFCVW